MDDEADPLSFFKPKILDVGPKVSLVQKYEGLIFKAHNDTFFIKKALRKPSFEKNLFFDLSDHQEDTLRVILSHND